MSGRPVAECLIENIGELVTCAGPAPRCGEDLGRAGVVDRGAVAVAGGRIIAVGGERDVIEAVEVGSETEVIDAHGQLVTPGFVDAHTHPVFAGFREAEFNRIVAGETYQEIALAGGGIRGTVRATREATADELTTLARGRLDLMILHGTTAAEVKSGYGLDLESERRSLEVLQRLDAAHPLDLAITNLAAHALPEEYLDRREEFVELVIKEILPATAELSRFCDVFCDETAFSVDESRRILQAGLDLGLAARIHADEFSSNGGAELAAELGATTADHLGGVSCRGISRLAEAGVTAVLLPGTLFFLGKHEYAPARDLVEAGTGIALGTDLNPGSSHTESMLMILQLSCLMMRMTIDEALVAATLNAAYSLGLGGELGSLEVGKKADLVIFSVPNRFHLVYHYGINHVDTVLKEGLVRVRGGRLSRTDSSVV